MNPLLRNYFLLLGLLVVIALIFRPSVYQKSIDWNHTYYPYGKEPFGTYILNQEIDNFFGASVKRYESTPYEFLSEQSDSLKKYNFIWINQHIDDVSAKKILRSVHNGSYALLVFSGSFFSDANFLDSLQIKYKPIHSVIDSVSFQLTTKNTENKLFTTDFVKYINHFYNFDTQQSKILGYSYLNDKKYINFIEVSYGKGKLLVHLDPIVFTNYFLKKDGFDQYTASTLAYLPQENETIWFDTYFVKSAEQPAQNFLSIIFKYPALAMAWRIFLIGFLLYIIFQGKRQQRIIPILNKEKNTTIEFTQTIANLYFQEDNTTEVVKKKILYFLDNIRNQFYIDTQKIDDDFLHKLQQKSNQNELSKQIISLIQTFEKNKVADQAFLIQLDKYITDFWKKVRK